MKKILAIDDEPHVLTVIKKRLEANGYQVQTLEEPAAGLRKAAEWKPDLILLDISMPQMNGFEVLRRLKSSQTTVGIPVVMLSAAGVTENIFEAEKLWAADFVIKPFTAEDLLMAISRNL